MRGLSLPCCGLRRHAAAAAAVAVAAACLLTFASAASGAPQLQMAQATLVLQPLGNSSEATAATDVLVGVQLLGGASGPVTASLRLLLPPGNASASQPGNGPSSSNTSSSGSGGSADDGAWAPADPAELWLEPSSLTWRAGEPAGAKRVRLRSAAELPLAAVLGEALYAAAGAASPSDAGGSGALAGSAASGSAAGQPLLRVQLHNSRGADIDQQRSSTTVLLDAEGGGGSHGAQAVAGSGVGEAADAGLPLFGFVANQAAYPPTSSYSTDDSSSSTTTNSSSGVASIPVRLLAGQVRGRATLRYVVSVLGGTAAAGGSSTRPQRQFIASKALSGFIQFHEAQAESPAAAPSPAPATATLGANPTSGGSTTSSGNVAGSARAAPGVQQEQLVLLPLAWDRILPGAEHRLGLELFPVFGARVQPQPDAVALHVFGSPLGSCPPGSALKDGGSGGSGAAHTLTTSDDGFTEGAEFGLFLNGSVIDLTSGLLDADVREYAAMVDSDVTSVTLCLRDSAQGAGSVQVLPAAAGQGRAAAPLRPAPDAVAEEACGCEGGSDGHELGSGGVPLISAFGVGGGSTAEAWAGAEQQHGSAGACEYTAWVLPLQAGQNEFSVRLPASQPAAGNTQAAAPTGTSGTPASSSSTAQEYSLAVVRLADPEHAELESITVKSSNDSTVLLCGPSSSGGTKLMAEPAARAPGMAAGGDTGSGNSGGSMGGRAVVPAPVASRPCRPGELLTLDVSQSSRLMSLTPSLRHPDVPGVRVEVNGQVLSRGGDVAADQLEDTTAAAQQRSNATFLPSAFIMGLLPGSHLNAEVVVVAEDGVTTSRYPVQFTVVAAASSSSSSSKNSSSDKPQQQLAPGTASDASAATAAVAATAGTAAAAVVPAGSSSGARPRGWPLSPALQSFCSICPAGWAAGAANSSACHMCPPGGFAQEAGSVTCLSCGPGTFAYSWGSAYCKNCIEGTYAPTANSSLCLPCPANTTTREDGRSSCDVPLTPGTYQAPRYAVVISFWVMLNGVDPQDVVMRAGVNAAPEAIVTSLIRADTAHQFNISIDDVQVMSVQQVARRTLRANVTATLGVNVPAGATDEDIDAALEVERLSADDSLGMLSTDPDRFFGRTAKALEVELESAVEGTTQSKPGGSNTGLLLAMLVPGLLAIAAGTTLLTLGCRKSRTCAKWRAAAARRLATTRLAPRATAYSRYSGTPAAVVAA